MKKIFFAAIVLLMLLFSPKFIPDILADSPIILETPTTLTPAYGNECSTSWKKFTNNRGHPFYLTLNTNKSSSATNSGIWRPNLPHAGQYKVEAYVGNHGLFSWPCPPPNNATVGYDTSDARYKIYHAGGSNSVTGNQRPLENQWLTLGTFEFNSGTGGYVKLVDLNGETNLSRTISFGAMRFTPIGSQISGRVTDGLYPVPGVSVSTDTGRATITNINGDYTFTGLSDGTYIITPDASGCTFGPPFHPITVSPSRDHIDFVTSSDCRGLIGNLIGHVTKAGSGAKIKNVRVSAGGKVSYTNSDGFYSIQDIPEGDYKLYVSADGYKSYRISVKVHADQTTNRNASLTQLKTDGYRLPFSGGKTYRCTQGNNGPYSHTGRYKYAFDWGMGVGHKIVASRDGRVAYVKEYSSRGGCSSRYISDANYVAIKHSDNTITWYFHLKKNSVPVSVGQSVKSGQVIGEVGLTGWVCGAHLHIERRPAYRRYSIPYSFLDVSSNGGVPIGKKSYKSGNYLNANATNSIDLAENDDLPPDGDIQFQLTGSLTHTVKPFAFDYHSDQLQMRLGATYDDLQVASWQPLSATVTWTNSGVWAQYKDETDNVSEVYSDTIDSVAFSLVQAAFTISPTVCVDSIVPVVNQTTPFCEQCGWDWHFGNGESSSEAEPAYPDFVYATSGVYTVELSAAGVNNVSVATQTITILSTPETDFTITQSGKAITVEAGAIDATGWQWDFGDGITATGRIATHTYTSTEILEQSPIVQLTVENSNGCAGMSHQYVSVQTSNIYLPIVIKNN